MLRLYHTAVSGANALSYNGTWDAFDLAELDGTNGGSDERKLFLAPARSVLTLALAASTAGAIEVIRIDHPVFISPSHRLLVVGAEKLRIIESGGFGERDLTVERGYDSTTAAAHNLGDAVINCYNYQGITLGRTGANASRLTLAPDVAGSPGSYAASLSPANIAYDGSSALWRKITVAAATAKTRDLAALPSISCSAVEALKAA